MAKSNARTSKKSSTRATGKRPDHDGQEESATRLGLLGGGGSDRSTQPRKRSAKDVNVKPTRQSIAVGPERAPLPAPTVAAAIDHRKQIVGIDDTRKAKRRKG